MEIPNGLFPGASVAEDSELADAVAMKAIAEQLLHQNSEQYKARKIYQLRLITSLVIRLSLIASIWLFVFDRSTWPAMAIFALLSFISNGIEGYDFITK